MLGRVKHMLCSRLVCAAGVAGLVLLQGQLRAQQTEPKAAAGVRALPQTIPIFPLPDASLFPNVSRPLNIFEQRYREMVADALKGDRIIGMVMLRPGFEADYDGRPPIYPVGCAGVIADAVELPDGRYNIVLRGLVKFRVASEDQSRAYRLARVDALPESLNDEDRAALRTMRDKLAAVLQSVAPGIDPPPAAFTDEEVVNTLAQYWDFDPVDRQQLLERDGALSRSRGLMDLLSAGVTPPR
jgi:Lon protease-like protein